jgi:DNA polymerase I-like protein with 3'-5' exonuclease and polymerase domains
MWYPDFNHILEKTYRNLNNDTIIAVTNDDCVKCFNEIKNKKSKYLAIDLETRGYIPSRSNLHGVGLYDGNHAYYLLWLGNEKVIKENIKILNDSVTWLVHNIKFEYKWCLDVMGVELKNFEDTILYFYSQGKDDKLNLAYLANTYLDRKPYKFDELINRKSNLSIIKNNSNGLTEYKHYIPCINCGGSGKIAGKVNKYSKTKFNTIELNGNYFIIDKKTKILIDRIDRENKDDLFKPIKCSHCKGIGSSYIKKESYGVDLVPLYDLANYCGEDVIETWLLAFNYCNFNDEIYLIEKNAAKYIMDMDDSGCGIDIDRMSKLNKSIYFELIAIQQVWEQLQPNVKITSSTQLKKLFFDELKLLERCSDEELKLSQKSKTTGQINTDSNNLELLQYLEPELIELKLNHSKLNKLYNTYTSKLIEKPIVHTAFNQTVTKTGRLSSSYNNFYPHSTNLQNIPNSAKSYEGLEIRKCFIPKKEGYKILCLDYSQFELRILAYYGYKYLNNHFLSNLFLQGKDIHTVATCIMYGLDYDSFDKANPDHNRKRTITKTINFGIVYGMAAPKLSMMLKISLDEGKRLFSLHRESLSGIWDIIFYLQFKAILYGYSETLLGRKRYYNFETYKLQELKGNFDLLNNYKFWYNKGCTFKISPNDSENLRQASNAPIQGTNADAIKIAMAKIYPIILNSDNEIYPIMQIHDELVFEVLENKAEYYKKIIEEIMVNSISLNPILIEVSGNVGNSWGESK